MQISGSGAHVGRCQMSLIHHVSHSSQVGLTVLIATTPVPDVGTEVLGLRDTLFRALKAAANAIHLSA